MSIWNSAHLEGEVTKAESLPVESDVTLYKFVLKVERKDERPKAYDYLDVYAEGTNDYDPWRDIAKGLCVAFDGEIRQEEPAKPRFYALAVRLVPQITAIHEDACGLSVVETKSKEQRILREITRER